MLREEERLRIESGVYDSDMDSDDDDVRELRQQARKIRAKQLIATQSTRRKKMSTKPVMPRIGRKVLHTFIVYINLHKCYILQRERSRTRLESELGELGVDLDSKRMV